MGLRRTGADVGKLQQMLTHQVRQLPLHRSNAQIDAGFSEIDGLELGVAIGHVQKRHRAKTRDVVQPGFGTARCGLCVLAQPHAGHGARTHHLQKFTLGQIHNFAIAYI